MKIEVFKNSISSEVIHTFNSVDSFLSHVNSDAPSDWYADQIAFDGKVYLGWDEIEELLNTPILNRNEILNNIISQLKKINPTESELYHIANLSYINSQKP